MSRTVLGLETLVIPAQPGRSRWLISGLLRLDGITLVERDGRRSEAFADYVASITASVSRSGLNVILAYYWYNFEDHAIAARIRAAGADTSKVFRYSSENESDCLRKPKNRHPWMWARYEPLRDFGYADEIFNLAGGAVGLIVLSDINLVDDAGGENPLLVSLAEPPLTLRGSILHRGQRTRDPLRSARMLARLAAERGMAIVAGCGDLDRIREEVTS